MSSWLCTAAGYVPGYAPGCAGMYDLKFNTMPRLVIPLLVDGIAFTLAQAAAAIS